MYAKRTLLTLITLVALTPVQTAYADRGGFHAPTGYTVTAVEPYRLPEPIPELPAPFERKTVAIERVIAHEGGYADHRADPGGPTKYGITWRTARHYGYSGPMSKLTLADAHRIYGHMWDEYALGTINDHELAAQALDALVAHGPRAMSWIREGRDACLYLNHRRMAAYRNSKGWGSFGRGWSKRVRSNIENCA